MRKNILFALVGIGVIGTCLVFVTSFFVTNESQKQDAPKNSLRVVASFFPYAEFARGVAGEDASIVTLVPSGVEPHDFEPTPRDIEKLYRADVVIINGAGIDALAEKLIPEITKRGVRVLRMSDNLHLPSIQDAPSDGSSEVSQESALDPHFWLDPVLAEIQVKKIMEVFLEIDPAHQEQYKSRGMAIIQELQLLDQEYTSGLQNCHLRSVVTAHDAFTYLAKRYSLDVISIAGLSPNAEPSPKRLIEITQLVREQNIKYIFFETLSSPKLSETLARESGIGTLVFNPIESGMIREDGHTETYFSLMRENLAHLRIALECL